MESTTIQPQKLVKVLSDVFSKLITVVEGFEQDELKISLNDIPITPKNLYNFAKSFCHVTVGDNYLPLPQKWVSLDEKMRKEILDRLNQVNNRRTWFDIRSRQFSF